MSITRVTGSLSILALMMGIGGAHAQPTTLVEYDLPGDAAYQAKLYPPPGLLAPGLGLQTPEQVIAHFTKSSLDTDGIEIAADSLEVMDIDGSGRYRIRFAPLAGFEAAARQYATVHPLLLDAEHAGQAINGAEACRATPGCWNPMAGYPVNRSDGEAKWHLFLPLGMPMVNHKAVTLLHYPPYVALRNADYLHNMTLQRWQRLLLAAGIAEREHWLYDNILDVAPIAAPGSGQAEYPNDYLPIMLSSVYFDHPEQGRNYLKAMLDTALNPAHNADNPSTLPLLVGGSPLYDPQAPGWFRVAYKAQMPRNRHGIPQMRVLQAGTVRISTDSTKLTPYLGANHMIAAGVTGRCTDDAAKIPDIRRYEAEDLVAACFVRQLGQEPGIGAAEAKRRCCGEWFGNDDCAGAPAPARARKEQICVLAQIDLHFNGREIKPMCTRAQAERWCREAAGEDFDPCRRNDDYPNCFTPPTAN